MDENVTAYKELQKGTPLCGGKYVIEMKLGEGGFGITYRAVQRGLNRMVCIKEYFLAGKCIRDTYARTVHVQGTTGNVFEKYRLAFVREAKLLATLHHPNIVEVIDVFDENNTSYMVMPFIEGRSLQNIVENNGRLSYPEAVNYIAQISSAVGYIHERHILHRDIKPDNIMITADFKAILIDFGSAREFEQDKTQIHTSMLTHGYAPTEQYTANSRKGSYTDIYAIGATLYFILTGEVPVEAAARLTERMPTPQELNPEIPDEANRTILKAMQLKSENRHQTIDEFMDDLRNVRPSVIIDETIGAGTTSKKYLWISLVAAASIITCVALYVIFGKKVEPTPTSVVDTKDFTGLNLYPMVKVKGGTFTMGSADPEDDDCPPHKVTVGDFYIGQFEVSQELWKKVMGNNPSEYQDDEKLDFPVENVSFDDVQTFINKLNKLSNQNFSLPTEAQWEYAARGGEKSHGYKFSVQYPNNIWFDKDHPFRIKFPPSVNELGIYQMSGNVAEWCLDYYDKDFYKKCSKKNPVNTKQSEMRVIRGGSFNDSEIKYITVFYRDADKVARPYVGFRLVKNL